MTFIEQQAQAWTDIREKFSYNETPNGPGSTLASTENVRADLPQLLADYGIGSILDAPCGDQNWMQHVDLDGIKYVGWDVEPTIIATNQSRWPTKTFACKNLLTTKAIPLVDLILCRDFTIHLPTEHVEKLLEKFRHSGAQYLLTTNYPAGHNDYSFPPEGHDGRPGYYAHPWNLEIAPFNLPGRVDAITEDDGDHELVLFDLSA